MKKVSGHRPGGGIASNKRVDKPVRTGKPARGTNERAVSQIGSNMGNHITEGRRPANRSVEKMHARPTPAGGNQELGNECAARSKTGVGMGRTIYPQSGSQGVQDGNLHPMKRQPGY